MLYLQVIVQKTRFDMELLFKSIADVKAHVGWLYASTSFDTLKSDLELATEDVCAVISDAVYQRALRTFDPGAGSGSGSGSGEDVAVNSELVNKIQLPVALLAVLSYMNNADLSHNSDGRKVKIKKDEESLPWEWMIERDNAAIQKKANRAIDRLVEFLDSKDLDEWKESDQCKDRKNLFVPDATTFDNVVPIDRSRAFFIRILPFVRKEDKGLRSLMRDQYDSLKKANSDGNLLSADQTSMLSLCQDVVVYGAMARAVRHFSIQVLPDSVVQRFDSPSQTQKASQVATASAISAMEKVYLDEKAKAEKRLAAAVKKTTGVTDEYVKDYSGEKFFSV